MGMKMFLIQIIFCRKPLHSQVSPLWSLFHADFSRCTCTFNFHQNGFCTGAYPEKPKKPVSAFFSFVECTREELKKKNIDVSKISDLMKKCSALWKDLPEEQRNAWLKDAADRFAEYKRQYEQYKTSLSTDQKFQLRHDSRKKAKERAKIREELVMVGKPVKPSPVMALFAKSLEKNDDSTEKKGLMGVINQWKALSLEEKQVYYDIQKVQWKAYVEAYNKWKSQPEIAHMVKLIPKLHAAGAHQEIAKMKLYALGLPKKPPNQYLLFLSEKSKETKLTPKELTDEWKKLSDEGKQVYIDKSNIEMKNYKKKYAEWMKQMVKEDKIKIVEELLANMKVKRK